MSFVKAQKHQAKLRMGLIGPAGSGKTYSALRIASALGKGIALIDTENASSAHYADEFDFDVCTLTSFSPETYTATIHEAEKAGYDVLIIDSLSHAWAGKGGALRMVDDAVRRSQSGNSYTAWREVTPKHNEMVDAIVQCKCHIIVTLRAKMEYVQEKDERGKTTVRKIGLQPVQRDQLEFEFDVVGDITDKHCLLVSKTRCKALTDGIFEKPGEDVAKILLAWLTDGAPQPETPAPQFQPAQPAKPASQPTQAAPPAKPAQPAQPQPTQAEQPKPIQAPTGGRSREELVAKYGKLAKEAIDLGIKQIFALPANATDQQICSLGQALSRQVQAAKAKAGVQNGK